MPHPKAPSATAIEAVMLNRRSGRPGLAAVLRGLAGLYGAVARCRAQMFHRGWLASHRLPCRVVSVGNLALGGTGKTPMTLYLAHLIHGAGYRAAVVSRGYRGAAEGPGGVVSDGRALLMGPAEAGDEPFLMARRLLPLGIPVIVGHNRVRSGRLAVARFQAEVVVLDDGFQHLRLQRDLDLVLLDAANPFGNGFLLPRGVLREPPAALARADACLLTRSPPAAIDRGGTAAWETCRGRVRAQCPRPLFPAVHVPFVAEEVSGGGAEQREADARDDQRPGGPVYAFSGIARNEAFRTSLHEMGFDIRGWRDYADHHVYTAADLRALEIEAQRSGAGRLATTEKDRVKIAAAWVGHMPLLVIGVRMAMGVHAEAFERFVLHGLGLGKRRTG